LRRPTELALLLACLPAGLAAQGRDVDVLYGRWYNGNRASTYELRSGHFATQVLVHDSLGRRRAFYGAGWEVQVLRRRSTLGPYIIAGVSLGLSTDTSAHALAALWNLGGGVEWRPIAPFALGLEARYRLEDRGPRGFWRPDARSPDGVSLAVGMSVALRGGGRTSRPATNAPRLPPPEVPLMIAGGAADVVRTALDVLGTPYQWGGTAANGFDCSGLIQYAYAQHGIRLPRMSRDQAAAGSEVAPVLEALKPGDILLFAARAGGGVTHVGMYVGEQKFIHSSSVGVKLSRLEVHDPDGAWWLVRWIGARRIRE
jgi:cell wall-associated NlpC family hydrolase